MGNNYLTKIWGLSIKTKWFFTFDGTIDSGVACEADVWVSHQDIGHGS
jgi:hypothetical protein